MERCEISNHTLSRYIDGWVPELRIKDENVVLKFIPGKGFDLDIPGSGGGCCGMGYNGGSVGLSAVAFTGDLYKEIISGIEEVFLRMFEHPFKEYDPDSIKNFIDICKSLENSCLSRTVYIPEDVINIGDYAFSDSRNRYISDIVLHEKIETIGTDVFKECSSLKSLTIPASVKTLGVNPFCDCNFEVFVAPGNPYFEVIHGGLIDIAAKRFIYYPPKLSAQSYTVPEGITRIEPKAFKNCKNLVSITLPHTLTSIGREAFAYCSDLEKIVLPDGINSIGDYTFSNCGRLKKIVLPDSVSSIGDGAFVRCSNLEEIVLPDSISSIGKCSFSGCSKLQKIVLPDGIGSIDYETFEGCSNLEEIVLPDSVSTIWYHAFAGCSSLEKIVLPDSVSSIHDGAFEGCVRDGKYTCTLVVGRDSYAESYAVKYGFPYIYA